MLYLDKLIAQLAYPLGASLLLGLLSLGLLLLGYRRAAPVLLACALAWLGLWSTPLASDWLRASLERRFEPLSAADLPVADAAVVLGGGIGAVPPDWTAPDLGQASDRVWHAARLFHAGKAPRLILSGGYQEWLGERRPEAQGMRQLLTELGVPASALLLESRSRSTRENALATATLLTECGCERVLLVTSALHMPRALATFRAAGVTAIPAPTDFEVMPEPAHLLRWLPDARALADSTRALKEYLGWWVYRWRGWA